MVEFPYNKLTDYFIKENKIDTTKEYEISEVPARSLLCPERFDLIAKWLFVDSLEKQCDISFAREIYRDSINAFSCGSYLEPGSDTKNSFDIYQKQFIEIIQDIKNNGFDENKSLIPVGVNNIICDGAHRVAAAAYYDKNVTVIKFPELYRNYNYSYFRNYLMNDENMGYMATTYTEIMRNCYMLCLWPKTKLRRLKEIRELIVKIGSVVYEQSVYLNYNGLCNFMAQIYGHQSWTGNIDSHFSGVTAKATACYDAKFPVYTIVFSCWDFTKVLQLKKTIRKLFKLENHSVHISDNSNETILMTRLLYNPNSVRILNSASLYKYPMVFKEMERLKDFIFRNGLKADRFIFDSDCIMEVCGFRAVSKVHCLTDYSITLNLYNTDCQEEKYPYYCISKNNMLYNPTNYFYFNGMKFLSIKRLIEMKRNRKNKNDIDDIVTLENFEQQKSFVPKKYDNFNRSIFLKKLIEHNLYGYGNNSYFYLKYLMFKKKLYSFFHFLKYFDKLFRSI